MALIQIIFSASMLDGYQYGNGAVWSATLTPTASMLDGYNYGTGDHGTFSFETTRTSMSSDGMYQGGFLNWGGFGQNTPIGGFENTGYQGYSTNWAMQNISTGTSNLRVVDVNTLAGYPKDQTIYYKLKGYNEISEAYESWVISEDITMRPEIYNPTGKPINRDNSIYYTPPSGNKLINVVIVARWVQ